MTEHPKPQPPSPAAMAGRRAAVQPIAPPAPAAADLQRWAAFGRVDDDGTVYVRTDEGERPVGSYPGSTAEEALTYFARKFEELHSSAQLLEQRIGQTDLSAQDARESLKTLREQIGEAKVVGDLAALEALLTSIDAAVKVRAEQESAHRAEAKAAAATEREVLVAEAEALAAKNPRSVQWKQDSARVRSLLEDWKKHQRSGPRLDKDVESGLWQRFSAARSTFDRNRKAWFAQLDEEHEDAKRTKTKLVAEAEALAGSKDWGPTAGAFKRLMQQWRQAGRASRSDDDALWERFKAAQDSFFEAKDEVSAAENAEFEKNLVVKEELLTEAEALLPVTDLEQTKRSLRSIQDRWDVAGKVPREAMSRVEGRLRKVEQAVRDQEDAKWKRSNPEVAARAQSMVEQLERAVADLEDDLDRAKASGSASKVEQAQQALDARRTWLDSARAGLADFGN